MGKLAYVSLALAVLALLFVGAPVQATTWSDTPLLADASGQNAFVPDTIMSAPQAPCALAHWVKATSPSWYDSQLASLVNVRNLSAVSPVIAELNLNQTGQHAHAIAPPTLNQALKQNQNNLYTRNGVFANTASPMFDRSPLASSLVTMATAPQYTTLAVITDNLLALPLQL